MVRPIVPNVTSATPSRLMSPTAAVDWTAWVVWLGLGSSVVYLKRTAPVLSREYSAPGGDGGGDAEPRHSRAVGMVSGHARTSCPGGWVPFRSIAASRAHEGAVRELPKSPHSACFSGRQASRTRKRFPKGTGRRLISAQ